mmetsp:Transcript_116835/g.371889  ORF Transcript_116835/g.371889 Transcript_116835/m.371889 type:complete len:252 (-) Transcript_116835:858-1613(-)
MMLALAWFHQIHESSIVVRGVTWHTGDNTSALVHLDCQQRQQVANVIFAGRASHLAAHKILSHHVLKAVGLAPRCQDILEAHVAGGPMGAHVDCVCISLEATVLALRQDPAIRLARHRLSPESRSQQKYLLALQVAHGRRNLHQLNFDGGVLLWADTFAFSTIMIHASLPINLTVDGRALAETDLLALLELPELPANERVIVGVHRSRYEGATEVHRGTEPFQITLAKRWEVLQPMQRVAKSWHVVNRDAH